MAQKLDLRTQPKPNKPSPLAMIAMRLRLSEGERLPFEFIQVHETADKVFVFIVHTGTPVTLEDGKGLFPSDTLISQLLLLKD